MYQEEYVAAASGVQSAEGKDDTVRQEARQLMKQLFAKLDALSHFHFAPKPVIEEMSVRADVPALAMEEIAPQVCCLSACMLFPPLIRDHVCSVVCVSWSKTSCSSSSSCSCCMQLSLVVRNTFR